MSWAQRIHREHLEESNDYESMQHRIRQEYPRMSDRLEIRARASKIWREDRQNGFHTKWSRAYEIALKEYTADRIAAEMQRNQP